MAIRFDFMNWVEYDMSMKILMCLEDPSDLVRASSVSRFWRHFGELLLLLLLFVKDVDYVFCPNLT